MAYALTTDDSASRRVLVKNLSPITKQEDIIIHFQRRGNGGGEVDSVHMLNERAAVVTFEKSTVAESVLKRQHEIHGSLVTVELYRPMPDQVFGRVSGRIDPNTLNASNHSMKTILQQIQDETKVEWKEIFDGFVVSGTFDQIKAVNELVKNKLTEKKHGKNVFSPSLSRNVSRCDKASSAPPVMAPSTETFRKTRDQSYETTSTSSSQADSQSSANEPMPETQVIDGCVQSSQLSLNPDDVLQSVLEKYHSNEPQTFKKVKTDASDKYSTLNGIPASETVTDSGVVFSDANVPMKKTAKKTQQEEKTKEHCRLTTSGTSSEQIKGKKDAGITSQLDYEIAEERKSYACDLQAKAEEFHATNTENESDSTPPVGMEENAEQSQNLERDTTSNVISNTNQKLGVTGKGTYMFDTVTGLRVWLTKGDITSQQDDILLSPIDPSLSFKSDFLKRIFRKGGEAIKREYLHKKEAHAHPHDPIITGGGNLPCRAIVFAGLPLWNNEAQDKKKRKQQIHRRLKKAIILASGCRHKSMALPLLGQDGNDIQDSAEIIVRVIASFGKNIDPMHSGINEFRIVCKDEASLAVVVNEFSSFSFHPGQLFFVNRLSSINNLVQAEETDVTLASENSQRNKPEKHDLSSEKVRSMDSDKETSSRNETSTHKTSVDHIDEPQAPYKSLEVTVGKVKGPPLPSISPSCQIDSASHQNHIDTKHEAEEDGSPSGVKDGKETTIGNVPSSCGRYTTSHVASNGNHQRVITDTGFQKFDTVTGLKVVLVKGDITSQQVDVLVSPIDSSFSFKSDLLKRILEEGGEAIKREYLSIKETNAPLQDPVIIGGGDLPCRALLFAVLPQWNNEIEEKRKCKKQIHRRLKEAITLASGYRHKSAAFPLLGQDYHDIPVEVSAEVIVRVIASFGKNVGPMHSGINEFRIVCEDEASFAAVVNQISSFSFSPGQPFFVSRSSNSTNLADVTLASQNSQRNKPEMHDLSSEKVSSMDPDKEASSRIETSTNKTTVDHIDEPQAPSKSSEVTVGKEKGPPLPSISSSSQVESASCQNHIDWDTKHEAEEDGTASDVKHREETTTIGNVSCSSGKYTTSHVASNGNHQRVITDTGFQKFDSVTGLKVVLVKGDITSQQVDVLVSPIDSSFSFKSDLLKRILEEGGEAIKREYLSIKETNAPLQDPVITGGGDLPCRALLFAVLPQWKNEIEEKQKCKKQIRRRLKGAITLASRYRHKSVAFPLLGQDYNYIPVEVFAEVIVRVIASFGKNLGPMHSGINEFRIVCEDEASFGAVFNQISSFSFPSGQPFFVSRSSNSTNLAHAEETARNEASINKMSLTKVISLNQDQEAPRITEFSPKKNTVDQVDEVHVVSQVSASKSSEVTGYSSSFIHPSRQCHSTSHQNHESKEDGTPNDERQVHEMTICHVPSSSVHCVEISVTRASEILQVTSVNQRVQEKIKGITLQDQPHLEFVADLALNLKEEEMRTGISKIEEKTVGIAVTQEVTTVDRDPQLKSSLEGRNQGERTQETENNRSLSSTKFTDINITDTKIQGLDENSQEESASSFHIQPKVTKKSTVLYKKVNQTEVGNNWDEKNRSKKGKTVYPPSRPIPGIGDKELKEKGDLVWKDECVERKKGDQKLNGEVPDRDLNERQVPILCALCHDSVDHPELTHPNTCMKHKFCDDCIINAFTFSNICPACSDTVGLITSKKRKVDQNQDLAHSSIRASSYHLNKGDKCRWTGTPNSFPANQPPGEMIWKKYPTSLPGFEGYGTIAVRFTFYDGVQGLDHPNPGMPFKGTQCIAYIPETLEGKEVLKLLRKAFAACLLFTISSSAPEGIGNVSLNDIELKTSLERHSRNGYPDDGYLRRVRNQLAAKGFH